MSNLIPELNALQLEEALRDRAQDVARSTAIHSESFISGHILFKYGEQRGDAYLIDSGAVEIVREDGTVLCTLGPGEIFGEMALIDDGARTATARTAALSDLFVIPREALQNRLNGLDPIMSLLMHILVDRYRRSRIDIPEAMQHDQPQNVTRDIQKQKDAALKELRITEDIRRGLEFDEFIPVFQPILKFPERKVVGFEALIRWQHPDKGFLTPNYFIPAAERSGIIREMDTMMLREVCRVMPDFLKRLGANANDFFISVNLSGVDFETLDVIQHVRAALVDTGVDPRFINLEITESALIGDPDRAEQVLHGLKALGVSIALDDFGTGYSSLGYLHRFPIDTLKIDRSFVSQVQNAPRSLDIIRAIVGLAGNFKLDIVAEGIETEQDATTIIALGVGMGQGYLFGKPMAMGEALDVLG